MAYGALLHDAGGTFAQSVNVPESSTLRQLILPYAKLFYEILQQNKII